MGGIIHQIQDNRLADAIYEHLERMDERGGLNDPEAQEGKDYLVGLIFEAFNMIYDDFDRDKIIALAQAPHGPNQIRCEECGMPIPDMPEDATDDMLLCEGCYEKHTKGEN